MSQNPPTPIGVPLSHDVYTFDNLRMEQLLHDFYFHSDIDRLPLDKKLGHYALHLIKYQGIVLAETERTKTVVIDTFIIAVAAANAFKIRSDDILTCQRDTLYTRFSARLQHASNHMSCYMCDSGLCSSARSLAVNAIKSLIGACINELGGLTKTCEAYDERLCGVRRRHPLSRGLLALYDRDVSCVRKSI